MLLDVERAASSKRLRQFAWGCALVLALVGSRNDEPGVRLALRLAAALVFAGGTVWPAALRGPYTAVERVTYPGRWLVSQVLLAAVYFGVVTPLALCLRLAGRDALQLRPDPAAATYWRPCAGALGGAERYYRQF